MEKHFRKNPLDFRIYAGFEADNEKDKSSADDETTNIYKQNPILIGYHIESELNDVLQSGYYKSPLACNIVNWFVDEVVKLDNETAFYFKNTNKIVSMTEKNKKEYINNNVCQFCEKNY